jgi:ATP-dependent helicase HrpA
VDASRAEMAGRLPELMIRDARRLARRLDSRGGTSLAELAAEVEAAARRVERRRAGVPELRYPPDLPIVERHDDLLDAIRDNQVVIVAGETGSGKTTQLPKMCLELGRGVRGLIGHTQPRRIAARSVAERIAEELGVPVGHAVGYAVRFADRVSDTTLVKLMTDGILLAELHRDRLLTAYDTIILDEAHERSLNIDFLLGYLKRLLPDRPDLTVIVTSATIDTERFSRHFDDAPVVEVSGRGYPVEVRYRPIGEDDKDQDQAQAICDAVVELRREAPGDVLVFLSGEREIRDTADALAKDLAPGGRPVEILPLYARLSSAEQHRVFAPHTGTRIILATNVAETSLTVPGIRYVIDAGTARVSRFNRRTKVQRLPIEPVSQASANQRAGRCGRVAPGVCIRLYAEEDYAGRAEFTEPEILRTNLASVILQMAALELGDIAEFPFVDRPDGRAINDGLALLEELGALDTTGLTPIGRQLTRLPIDVRFGRMLIEADREGSLRELLVITAGLSIQDPRERPADDREAAAASHARFADKDSDFLSILRLWDHLHALQGELSSNQFRKRCRAEFLNSLRVREWQDLHGQLRRAIEELGFRSDETPAEPERIHVAALAGLLSHIGMRDTETREYRAARDSRFAIAPGSSLAKKAPRWVMAAELVETNRTWARVVAPIEPAWAERLAPHLVRRTYGDPRWDARRGSAVTEERVTLYGLALVQGRTVEYGEVDPAGARDLFIEHALVEGDWSSRHRFLRHNAELIESVRRLEDRARRPLFVGPQAVFDFYDERVAGGAVAGRAFDRWWDQARRADPHLLEMAVEHVIVPGAGMVGPEDFPDVWRQDGLELALSYVFDPGGPDDGVSVEIPLGILNRVSPVGFDWHVPGMRTELVAALIRTLPKAVRRHFVPATEFARQFLASADPAAGPLLQQLERALPLLTGDPIPPGSWNLEALPPHLRMRFRVIEGKGRTAGAGDDLASLRRQLGEQVRDAIVSATGSIERTGLQSWTFGTLPRIVEGTWEGVPVRGYPALVDEGSSVGIRVAATEAEQRREMWAGTSRLLALGIALPTKELERRLGNDAKLALARTVETSVSELLDDCVTAAIDRLLALHGGPKWDADQYSVLRQAVRADAVDTAVAVVTFAGAILTATARISDRLDRMSAAPLLRDAVEDVGAQLEGLVHRRFVPETGAARLPDVLRYLRAIARRLDKLPEDPGRDGERMERIQRLASDYRRAAARSAAPLAERDAVRWMIEELRVSIFAQQLGTAQPVSEQRVQRAIDRLAG